MKGRNLLEFRSQIWRLKADEKKMAREKKGKPSYIVTTQADISATGMFMGKDSKRPYAEVRQHFLSHCQQSAFHLKSLRAHVSHIGHYAVVR